ncbi:nitrogen fixation protein NifU [Nonomuraea sp. NN258]|uniref:nitrogen fixation protein NifU n=1 Tax=Nonomuraea antri TaxID=2730852 RepID=UPI0015681E07|nr:nitrogen fixation protein NifU [Nonomuraea antri]NRQ38946.1 nitrogen fixation protein NifU [Nonomuraea antri]
MLLNERIGRIEALLERADPPAIELAQALLDLYGEGLTRIMAAADDDAARRLAGDPLVAHLLLLHDLHPVDVGTRVADALRGTGAELVDVADDLVRLRLPAGGCRSTIGYLEQAIRDAAPEIERVEIEQPPVVIPVDNLLGGRA